MLNSPIFQRPLLLLGAAAIVLSTNEISSRAADVSPSPAVSAAATAAEAAPASAASPTPAASATPAVSPTGSVEDRLASLEAYINNTDLSVLAQCLGITGLVVLLWWICGYSLVFGKNFNNPFYGGSEYFFLSGVTSAPNADYSYWVSQNVYAMFQLMFAVITPALIVGAIAERMKYSALMLFILFWMFLVYFPMAHMIWGITGFMNGIWNANSTIKAIDFAGGTVVHMTSGWSALILCLILGPRIGFKKEPMAPHSMVLCMVGTGMLWVGWYGFNAGSAVAADGIAANAFTTTTLATGVAALTWAIIEKVLRGKASVLGYCTGAVAGLVVITPACGFVNATVHLIPSAYTRSVEPPARF